MPASNVRVQLVVHELPAPSATVPAPEPRNVTLTSHVLMKLPLAVASEFSVNEQEVPAQALLQTPSREPELALDASVTAVPSGSCTEQVPLVVPAAALHEIAGVVLEEMLPEPLPVAVTVSVCMQVPQLVTVRAVPQLSSALADPQVLPRRAQKAASDSATHCPGSFLPLQPQARQARIVEMERLRAMDMSLLWHSANQLYGKAPVCFNVSEKEQQCHTAAPH
jgi:hypothetical protein